MAQSHIEVRVNLQDANGLPYPGFKAYFYNAGPGSTPRTVYTDEALTIAHDVPVVADAAGVLPRIFVPVGTYKAKYTTSGDVDIRTDDNIDPGLSTSAGALAVASGGTGATTAASARSNLSVPSQAVFDALDTRVTDVETTLANPLIAPNQVTTYAASINPNFTAKQVQTITLTGNLTLGATVTGTAGQEFTVILIQDATGNRVITLGAGFKYSDNVQPVFSITANSVDIISGIMRTASIAEILSIKIADGLGRGRPDVIIEHQEAASVSAGTATTGAWTARPLNTEVFDPHNLATLASNQITLVAGIYYFEACGMSRAVTNHQCRIQNITDASTVSLGTVTGDAASGIQMASEAAGVTSITASKVFELQYRVGSTSATSGLGIAIAWGVNVYARVKIWKIR